MSGQNAGQDLRILVVEDDVASRFLLTDFLAPYGNCHVAVDGEEAVKAVERAIDAHAHYHLICLDIMMPRKDGQQALREIRELEEAKGIALGEGAKIIMVTTVADSHSIIEAFNEQCEAYLIKPVTEAKLIEQMASLGLINKP